MRSRRALLRPSFIPAGNVCSFPTELDNAAWTKNQCTITANAGVAPDGTYTADKIVEGAGAAGPYIFNNAIVSGTRYLVQAYAKSLGQSRFFILSGGGLATASECPVFDLDNGVIDYGATSALTARGGGQMTRVSNNWWRCRVIVTPNSTTAFQFGCTTPSTNNNFASHAGDGSSGILLWGLYYGMC